MVASKLVSFSLFAEANAKCVSGTPLPCLTESPIAVVVSVVVVVVLLVAVAVAVAVVVVIKHPEAPCTLLIGYNNF